MRENPRAGRLMPGFINRFLSRMLRIDFMNDPILYKHWNKHFMFTFGKPIAFSTFDRPHTPVEWTALVKDHSYTLADTPDKEFSPTKP